VVHPLRAGIERSWTAGHTIGVYRL